MRVKGARAGAAIGDGDESNDAPANGKASGKNGSAFDAHWTTVLRIVGVAGETAGAAAGVAIVPTLGALEMIGPTWICGRAAGKEAGRGACEPVAT